MNHKSIFFLMICSGLLPLHAGKKKVDPKDVFILNDNVDTNITFKEVENNSSHSGTRSRQHHGSKTTHQLKDIQKISSTSAESKIVIQQDNLMTALNVPAVKTLPLLPHDWNQRANLIQLASLKESSRHNAKAHNNSFGSTQSSKGKEKIYPSHNRDYNKRSDSSNSRQYGSGSSSSSSNNDVMQAQADMVVMAVALDLL